MKLRAIIMLGLALSLGLASAWLARDWLRHQQSQPRGASEATRKVVVAARALDFGSRLGREDLREVSWPAASLPEGSYASIDDLAGGNAERIVLRPIEANEPVLAGQVTAPGGRATLSTMLPKDKRAITIRVNDVLGVAGFVLPGDRVDVLLTRVPNGDPRAQSSTDMLLQNLRVLGVDQEASERKEKPTVAKAVTLEVTPDEAEMLTLGGQVGSLSLALRNHADQAPVTARTITLDDLTSAAAKPARPPVTVATRPRHGGAAHAADLAAVEVWRGIDATTYQVRKEGGPDSGR